MITSASSRLQRSSSPIGVSIILICRCRRLNQTAVSDEHIRYIVHFPIALTYVDPSERYPPGWGKDGEKATFSKTPLATTWKAMEELVDDGLAKSIGVSNYSGSLILDLERYARIMPATLQIEHHPYLTQETLVKYAQSKGIVVTAYSSFGPMSYVELDMEHATNVALLFDNDIIKKVAKQHNKDPAQVLLRWATQRGVAVIPKSNNQGRLQANLDVCNFDLSDEDIKAISDLNRGLRFNDPPKVGFTSCASAQC